MTPLQRDQVRRGHKTVHLLQLETKTMSFQNRQSGNAPPIGHPPMGNPPMGHPVGNPPRGNPAMRNGAYQTGPPPQQPPIQSDSQPNNGFVNNSYGNQMPRGPPQGVRLERSFIEWPSAERSTAKCFPGQGCSTSRKY